MKKEKVLKYIIIGSTAAVIIMMAAATVIEKLYGSAQALSLVYHSPVFIALWAVAAISGVTIMIRRHTFRKPFTFLLHISLVLILAGALLTMLTGTSGIMELRRGETSAQWISDQGMRQKLPFKITLNDFSIEYYPGTKSPSDYISKVTLSDSGSGISSEHTISMNNILKYRGYRFYQSSYDDDMRGSVLAVSHDPWGVPVTYSGYLLLLISMAGFFFQKNSGFRAAIKRLKDHGNTL